MLFIPIDVLMMKPKSHLTSGLNHVAWFILHCLVFREQSLVLSNRAAHLSDLFIVSHRLLSVKNFFEFLFKNFLARSASNISQPLATQGLLVVFRCRISQRLVLWYTSFPHMSTPFSKKNQKRDCPSPGVRQSLPYTPQSGRRFHYDIDRKIRCPWRRVIKPYRSVTGIDA